MRAQLFGFSISYSEPNKAPEPTPTSVTPPANECKAEGSSLLINVVLQEARRPWAWLIFDVGRNFARAPCYLDQRKLRLRLRSAKVRAGRAAIHLSIPVHCSSVVVERRVREESERSRDFDYQNATAAFLVFAQLLGAQQGARANAHVRHASC